MGLTDTFVKTVKHRGLHAADKYSDGGGLFLQVGPAGKYWRLNYRFADKQKTLALGVYPAVTLAAARKRRDHARELLAAGVDPGEEKKRAKAASKVAAANSFEAVAEEWYAKKIAGLSEVHQSRVRSYLNRYLYPGLGRRPMVDIKAPELLDCLRKIEARKNNQGANITETANRVRSLMSNLWRYAISTGKCERDIAADLKGALTKHVERNFAHITDPALLGKLLREIETYRGTPAVHAALRILPMVFTRPGELRFARWADIDLDAAEWRYTVTKTGMPHVVPLAPQVVTILNELKKITGGHEYVFTSTSGNPISEASINKALRTLGWGNDVIVGHGFRHTASTMLAELGYDETKIDRQLSHLVPGVKGKYQKAKYLNDRRDMMIAWANYLDGLRAGANIVPIAKKTAA